MIAKIYKNLDDFEECDQELLVSMPYKAGIWMSYADMDGGTAAFKREAQALSRIIEATAENFCESSFVQEVAEQTLARRDRWDDWQKNPDNFPCECQRSIEIIAGEVSPEDVVSFKSTLLEVALAVARAYNERFEKKDFRQKISTYAGIWVERALARINGVGEDRVSAYDAVNISPQEEDALKDLARALSADMREVAEGYRSLAARSKS